MHTNLELPGRAGREGGEVGGARKGGGGEAGKLIRKGEKKKAMCPLPAVPPPPLSPLPAPGGLAKVPVGWLGRMEWGGWGDQRLAGGSGQPALPATTKSQTQQKQHMARAARGCKLNIKGRLDN